MVIKDAKKYNSDGTVQKKNKTKKSTKNPHVIIIDDDDEAQVSLPTKAKRGKKKHTVEGNGSSPKKKKKKKKKKLDSELNSGAFADLPITIQSRSEKESKEEAGKAPKALKKKRKRGLSCERESSLEIPSQGQTTECLEANFLVEKREKSIPEICEGDDGYGRKQKKKKHKFAPSLIPSQADYDYSKKDLLPTVNMISHEMILSDRKPTLMQDAVRKGESCLTSAESRDARNGALEKWGPVDPSHELQEGNNCKEDHKGAARRSKKRREGTEQEEKKKGKKKKKKMKEKEVDFRLTWASNRENHLTVSTQILWKTESEEKTKKTDLTQNAKKDSKGHKKEKCYAKVAKDHPHLLEDNKDAFDQEGKGAAMKRAKKKSKKAEKKAKNTQDPGVRSESSISREKSGKQCDATKRKAKKTERSNRAEEEPRTKQAKLEKREKQREEEIQVVAIKKGNCDEVKIDKLRRQALQEEIDRESGKTKALEEEDEPDHHFGQWSTATFDSAERKQKFLRLLGGFKQGPASTQGSPAPMAKRNMALTGHGEEKLQQTLQTEFEKAVAWKHRRGAGLGFQPAPQKKVYIDKYASKSVKFED